ncbi:MAG: cytochrome C [Desulfuromonas sp.]|nr:MAG: cytochrome C [Desulfuromonas sp.]
MGRFGSILLFGVVLFCGACAMFSSWKSIPAPGGCDQCHRVPIAADWTVTLVPAKLHDETDQEHWQRANSVLPEQEGRVEVQKVSERRCFRCHKGPNRAHADYQGRYHH